MGRLTDAFKNAKTSKLLSASDIVVYAKKSTFSKIFVLMWATLCVNNSDIESTWIINSHPK